MSSNRFSNRHGYVPEIRIRESAPDTLRSLVLQIPMEYLNAKDVYLQLCRVTLSPPHQYKDYWWGSTSILQECEWAVVYDIIEVLHDLLCAPDPMGGYSGGCAEFRDLINDCLIHGGIGWELNSEGQVIARGSPAFESALTDGMTLLQESQRFTAAKELNEARLALSRRPEADLRGAITHAMGCLECVARDLTGESSATLGDILKKHQDLLPSPLPGAFERLWGYTSAQHRHVLEGREVSQEEAELVVTLVGGCVVFLETRARGSSPTH